MRIEVIITNQPIHAHELVGLGARHEKGHHSQDTTQPPSNHLIIDATPPPPSKQHPTRYEQPS